METITEEEKEFTVTDSTGRVSTVIGKVVTTDHGVKDKDGIPKISTNIIVPTAKLLATPGEVA